METTSQVATRMRKEEIAARRRVNARINSLTHNTFFEIIPVIEIEEILEAEGFTGESLRSQNYVGNDGTIHVQVGPATWIFLTWHYFASGKCEVVAYAS